MGSCPLPEGDDRDLFLSEVSDAVALDDRDRVIAAKRTPSIVSDASCTPWTVESQGHKITARAHGVNRTTTQALATGTRALDADVDLHRLDADSARVRLAKFLSDSRRAGHHCVLVVSGRGKHSDGEGVLRRLVVDWITGSMSHHALALTTATPKHGGEGAFYVLLRKS